MAVVAAEAVGMVEVRGLSAAVLAANLAGHAAAVSVGGLGYLHEGQVMLTIRGSVDSVRAALDAVTGGLPRDMVRASSVIARPDPQVEGVIAERFVTVGGRVGAPRVLGRGRRYPPAAAAAAPAAPAAPESPAEPSPSEDDG